MIKFPLKVDFSGNRSLPGSVRKNLLLVVDLHCQSVVGPLVERGMHHSVGSLSQLLPYHIVLHVGRLRSAFWREVSLSDGVRLVEAVLGRGEGRLLPRVLVLEGGLGPRPELMLDLRRADHGAWVEPDWLGEGESLIHMSTLTATGSERLLLQILLLTHRFELRSLIERHDWTLDSLGELCVGIMVFSQNLHLRAFVFLLLLD